MEFLIITGLSGAGKSRAADVLEDLEYYCVDNMPVALMPRFAELCVATGGRYEKVALVTDVREKDGFGQLLATLDQLGGMDVSCRILYMDADTRTLVRRYKESRRPHPMAAPGISVEQAVAKEAELDVVPAPVNLAGEDFAYYQEEIPGVFVLVGTGKSPANHNPKFHVDPASLGPAARYMARLAVEAFARL